MENLGSGIKNNQKIFDSRETPSEKLSEKDASHHLKLDFFRFFLFEKIRLRSNSSKLIFKITAYLVQVSF